MPYSFLIMLLNEEYFNAKTKIIWGPRLAVPSSHLDDIPTFRKLSKDTVVEAEKAF